MPDELEVLEPAALDRLLRVGDQDFVIEMIDLFLAHAPQRLDAATSAAATGDLVTVHRSAHSLKSTAANIGAMRLRSVAAQVEAGASAGDAVGMLSLVERMQSSFEEVRQRLEAERARRVATIDPSAGGA